MSGFIELVELTTLLDVKLDIIEFDIKILPHR